MGYKILWLLAAIATFIFTADPTALIDIVWAISNFVHDLCKRPSICLAELWNLVRLMGWKLLLVAKELIWLLLKLAF